VNVITVEHVRDGVALDVRQTGVEVALETRGASHLREALDALEQAGYEVSEIH
jgi:ACT domain-containing protein